MKYILIISVLFCALFNKAQNTDTVNYQFIIAGHTYGHHAGTNPGIHPAFHTALHNNLDNNNAFAVLTGDITRYWNTQTWAVIDTQYANLNLPTYYVMGNHDVGTFANNVFINKHGNTYFHWDRGNTRFFSLNSNISSKAISSDQVTYLDSLLQNCPSTTNNIFIFFHHALWNSDLAYQNVESNYGSIHSAVVGNSNYWTDIHPLITAYSNKNFYVVSGDWGGRPEVLSLWCDKRDNAYLIGSGMGEAPDENYLLVTVKEDSIGIKPIPLDTSYILDSICDIKPIEIVIDTTQNDTTSILSYTKTNYFYPNPTNNSIYFKEETAVSIFSLQGKLEYNSDKKSIHDLSKLSNGVYFVRFKQNDVYTTINLIKR